MDAFRIGFLTLPSYSMIALSNALEPLRMANRICNRQAYEWFIVSLDGQPVAASNGLALSPTVALDSINPVNIVFVCGGTHVQRAATAPLVAVLRRLARRRVDLGALCTGSYALAKAGLLEHYRGAIHWENLSALREEFPHVDFVEQLFVIDRDRFTCSGGIAPLDLMLNMIERHHGGEIARLIAEQFILDRIRGDREHQHIPVSATLGPAHQTLIKAAALMEANIEEPLSLEALSASIGVSRRHIARLFKRHLNLVPARYYLELRLRRARELLLQTRMSITDVSVACGFQSRSHFAKCYRQRYGHPPGSERKAVGDGEPQTLESGNAALRRLM